MRHHAAQQLQPLVDAGAAALLGGLVAAGMRRGGLRVGRVGTGAREVVAIETAVAGCILGPALSKGSAGCLAGVSRAGEVEAEAEQVVVVESAELREWQRHVLLSVGEPVQVVYAAHLMELERICTRHLICGSRDSQAE